MLVGITITWGNRNRKSHNISYLALLYDKHLLFVAVVTVSWVLVLTLTLTTLLQSSALARVSSRLNNPSHGQVEEAEGRQDHGQSMRFSVFRYTLDLGAGDVGCGVGWGFSLGIECYISTSTKYIPNKYNKNATGWKSKGSFYHKSHYRDNVTTWSCPFKMSSFNVGISIALELFPSS